MKISELANQYKADGAKNTKVGKGEKTKARRSMPMRVSISEEKVTIEAQTGLNEDGSLKVRESDKNTMLAEYSGNVVLPDGNKYFVQYKVGLAKNQTVGGFTIDLSK